MYVLNFCCYLVFPGDDSSNLQLSSLTFLFLFLIEGVVFNEMKGVYSQPDNILGRAAQQASSPFV